MWECHGVTTWFTQVNTNVGQYYFHVLTTYIFYCFLNLKQTQKNTVVLPWPSDDQGMFQANSKCFDTTLSPQIDFLTVILYDAYMYVFIT